MRDSTVNKQKAGAPDTTAGPGEDRWRPAYTARGRVRANRFAHFIQCLLMVLSER